MSHGTSKSRRKKAGPAPGPNVAAHDRAVYTGLLMIGVFVVLLAVPLTEGALWRHTLIGYLLLMAIMINGFAWRACRGGKLARWQAALARIPLRWAGFGAKGGKPLETAHGRREARTALLLSIAASVVLLGILTVILIPGVAT